MSLFSLVFFSCAAALVCRMVPGRHRWGVILAASMLFYALESPKALPLLLIAAGRRGQRPGDNAPPVQIVQRVAGQIAGAAADRCRRHGG